MSYAGPSDLALQRVGLIRYAEDATGATIPDACFVKATDRDGTTTVPQYTTECLTAILGIDDPSHVLTLDDFHKVESWIGDNWQAIRCTPESVADGSCEDKTSWSDQLSMKYRYVWDIMGLTGKTIGDPSGGTYTQGGSLLGSLGDAFAFLTDPLNWLAIFAGLAGVGMIVYGGSRLL